MNAGRKVLRKMLLAAVVLAAGSWLAPSLLAQTGTNPRPADRPQNPSAKAAQLHSSLPSEKAVAKLGQLPMSFEENRGPTDPRVKFLSRGRGYTLFLTEDEAVMALKKKGRQEVQRSGGPKVSKSRDATVLRMKLAGANPARISGEEPLPGKIFYASGGQTGPLSGNATYKRVKYAQVYPGIELEYYGNEKQLEFDFVVAPHADPKQIRLSFSGAEKIKLTKHGELFLRVSGEEVRLKKPLIYQERNGEPTEIAAGYVLTGKGKREATFELAPYDSSLPLVIDPQIDFATYLGGAGYEQVTDVRVLPTGEIYLLGQTDPSTGFPTSQTLPPPGLETTDCFVSKLSPDGTTLLYSAVFPGTRCMAMAADLFGKVHLSLFEGGVGSFHRTLAEDSTGALTLTLLQGAFDFNFASAQNMQVDSQGNVYMVFFYYPPNSSQPEYGLFKVDANGQLVGTVTLLVPGTLPGGGYPPAEQVTGLAVDDAGHAFVIGGVQTAGRITPTANAFQPTPPTSNCGAIIGGFYSWCDGFVMEVDTNTPNSFSIAYASYLGGSGDDYMGAIAVGYGGALYITGQTGSSNFPITAGPYSGPPPCPGCLRGFVVKLDLTKAGSQQLVLGALIPIEMSNGGEFIAVLPGGLPAVLSNASYAFHFTLVDSLYGYASDNWGGPSLIVFSKTGNSIILASHLQPHASTQGWYRLASNGSGKLYVAGNTNDGTLGMPGAYQEVLAGSRDVLVRAISGIATNSPPTVDLGPAITIPVTSPSSPGPVSFTLDCGNTFPCTITDPEQDPLISFRWLGPNGFTATSASAPPVATLQLPVGSNKISLIVTDNQGAVGVGTLTVNVVVDTDPPLVTVPADLTVDATEAGGARGSASSLLHDFLFVSASAQDLVDPNPAMLPPQADFGAGPVDIDDQTLFPVGTTVVTFRFQDSSGNVGTGSASVTVLARTVIPPIMENITVTDDPRPLPSAMIPPITENITVTDHLLSADLALAVTVPLSNVPVGQAATITAVVTNNGPDPATNVTWDAQIALAGFTNFNLSATQGTCTGAIGTPLQCLLATLAPRASATITVVATPATASLPPNFLTLSVGTPMQVSAAEPDPDTTNNSTPPGFGFGIRQLSADLSVSSSVPASNVPVGQPATVSAVVSNNGPDPATNVIWDAQFALAGFTNFSITATQGACTGGIGPPLQCRLGSLAPGASATITVVATPTSASLPPNFQTLSVGTPMQVSASEPDPDTTNNSTPPGFGFGIRQLSAVINITEQINVTDAPPAVIPQDNTPPVVTPPANIVIRATEAGGARGNIPQSPDSQALANFLAGATATDAVDPNPVQQPTQMFDCVTPALATPADNTTLFPLGQSCVIFTFKDASGNIGTAGATVFVNPPIGGFVGLGGVPVNPTDANNVPMPIQLTFGSVNQPGLATASPVFPPPSAPSGFRFKGVVYDIATTALFTPPVEVCLLGSGFSSADRIWHNGAVIPLANHTWQTATKVCAMVNSLSPFGVVTPVNSLPTADAGANQTVEATSAAGASVTLNGSGSDPDGDPLTFAWSGPCGGASTATATFTCPLGTSTMTLTVDDGRGGTVTSTVLITIVDTTPPALVLPANIVAEATGSSGAAVIYSATANDLVDGARPVACSAGSGATFALGSTTVNCSASDTRGNTASGSFSVTVLDTAPPVLTLPPNLNLVATSSSGAVVNYSATASDAVDGSLAPSCSPASGATFAIGTTTVNCTATDAHGNSAGGSFSVTVSVGTPRITGAIAAKGRDASGNYYVDVKLTNTGTGHARNVRLATLTFRTLSGSGTVSYNAALSGALPLAVGNLDVGAATTVRLYLNVPATVTRFSLTEGGTLQDVVGSAFGYSLAQSVIP